MPLSLKDFTKLKGLMSLTSSDNDAECLASIRAANRLLVTNALTWEAVFRRTVTVVQEFDPTFGERVLPGRTPEQQNGDNLEPLFEAALGNVKPGSFRDTILDIHSKYEAGWVLTEKQRALVARAAEGDRGR